jgi:hypothetical protein
MKKYACIVAALCGAACGSSSSSPPDGGGSGSHTTTAATYKVTVSGGGKTSSFEARSEPIPWSTCAKLFANGAHGDDGSPTGEFPMPRSPSGAPTVSIGTVTGYHGAGTYASDGATLSAQDYVCVTDAQVPVQITSGAGGTMSFTGVIDGSDTDTPCTVTMTWTCYDKQYSLP